ncbi:MAG: MjaI family restriction endonuclease, partial [Actinomycetota bacterium]|nr:MjaI family restriction endonuclease [Actinomycetota bacterium]
PGQHALGIHEWDRRYNVDFFIRVGEKFIGIQVKPAGYPYLPQRQRATSSSRLNPKEPGKR